MLRIIRFYRWVLIKNLYKCNLLFPLIILNQVNSESSSARRPILDMSFKFLSSQFPFPSVYSKSLIDQTFKKKSHYINLFSQRVNINTGLTLNGMKSEWNRYSRRSLGRVSYPLLTTTYSHLVLHAIARGYNVGRRELWQRLTQTAMNSNSTKLTSNLIEQVNKWKPESPQYILRSLGITKKYKSITIRDDLMNGGIESTFLLWVFKVPLSWRMTLRSCSLANG